MPQETEDLALEPKLVHAGVAAVLSDPAKGAYFVLTVRARKPWGFRVLRR